MTHQYLDSEQRHNMHSIAYYYKLAKTYKFDHNHAIQNGSSLPILHLTHWKCK